MLTKVTVEIWEHVTIAKGERIQIISGGRVGQRRGRVLSFFFWQKVENFKEIVRH